MEEFHQFSQQVAEKQLTLRNEFLDVNLKKEYNFDDNGDGWDNDDHEDKFPLAAKETTEELTVNCPISMFKDETDNDDKDEQEVPTEDLLDVVMSNDEKDIIAPDSVPPSADLDYIPDQVSLDGILLL